MNKYIAVELSTTSAQELLRTLAQHACAAHENEVVLLPISGGAQTLRFRVWVDNVESVHTLVLNGDGKWYVTTSLEV